MWHGLMRGVTREPDLHGEEQLPAELPGIRVGVSVNVKVPNTKEREFEDAAEDAEPEAGLVLMD
jgi:hypothetical protein